MEKNNNKPHSVTMDIRGNKGLFAYYRKFKSITIDEKTNIMKMIIRKKTNNTKNLFTTNITIMCFLRKPLRRYSWSHGT